MDDEFPQELPKFMCQAEMVWHHNATFHWNPETKWPPKMH